MLETRLPPPSNPRTRRPDAAPRPVTRTTRMPRTVGSAALAPERVPAAAPEPIRRSPRLDRAAHARLARSEMRLMGLATICTAIVCGLLLLYLAAYAQVTRLGIAQADARVSLRQNRLQNEMLRAERDHLQSPATVIARATALGMTPRAGGRVDYLPASAKTAVTTNRENKTAEDKTAEDKNTEGDGAQGGSVGKTGITSFDH